MTFYRLKPLQLYGSSPSPFSVLSSHLSHVSLRPVPLRPRLLLRRHDVLGLPWSMWWFSPFSITILGAYLKYCSLAKQANSGYRSLLNAQFNNVYFIAPLCLAGAGRAASLLCLPAGCFIDSRLERVNDSSLPLSM